MQALSQKIMHHRTARVMIVGRKQIHMITTQIQDTTAQIHTITTQIQDTTAQIHTITTQIQDTTTQILIIIKMDILLMRVRRKSLTVKRKVHFAKSFWYVQRVRYCLAL